MPKEKINWEVKDCENCPFSKEISINIGIVNECIMEDLIIPNPSKMPKWCPLHLITYIVEKG